MLQVGATGINQPPTNQPTHPLNLMSKYLDTFGILFGSVCILAEQVPDCKMNMRMIVLCFIFASVFTLYTSVLSQNVNVYKNICMYLALYIVHITHHPVKS
jgi:hypothetical protein